MCIRDRCSTASNFMRQKEGWALSSTWGHLVDDISKWIEWLHSTYFSGNEPIEIISLTRILAGFFSMQRVDYFSIFVIQACTGPWSNIQVSTGWWSRAVEPGCWLIKNFRKYKYTKFWKLINASFFQRNVQKFYWPSALWLPISSDCCGQRVLSIILGSAFLTDPNLARAPSVFSKNIGFSKFSSLCLAMWSKNWWIFFYIVYAAVLVLPFRRI